MPCEFKRMLSAKKNLAGRPRARDEQTEVLLI